VFCDDLSFNLVENKREVFERFFIDAPVPRKDDQLGEKINTEIYETF